MTLLRRLDLTFRRSLVLLIFVVFFALFLVYPLLYTLSGAFVVGGHFSLTYFGLMLGSSRQWQLILNSINLAFGATLLSALIALPLAFVMVRIEFFAKRLIGVLLLFPLLLPPFVGALGFKQIAGRFGTINLLLMQTGILNEPVDILGNARFFGIVLLQALHFFPIMYLSLAAALGNLDFALEEAAWSVGASRLQAMRRIVLPLLFPALFSSAALVFVGSFTDLGTPLLFDYRDVLPVQIFNMLSDMNQNPLGYSLVVFVAVLSLAFFSASQSSGAGRYERSVRGQRPAPPLYLGRTSEVALLGALTLFLCLAFLPHAGVVLLAFSERWSMSILPQSWTLSHFGEVFYHPLTLVSIRNSVGLSLVSTLLNLMGGFTLAYLLCRTRVPAKWLLGALCVLPLAIPGIVFAFGYVGAFAGTLLDNRLNPFPLLIVAYAVRKLPYMVRAATNGFEQASVTLEEAAAGVGAPPAKVFRRVTLPLVASHLIAGSVLCFAFAMLEVSDSIILAMEDKFSPIAKALYTLSLRPDGAPLACALSVIVMLVLLLLVWIGGKLANRDLGEFFRGA